MIRTQTVKMRSLENRGLRDIHILCHQPGGEPLLLLDASVDLVDHGPSDFDRFSTCVQIQQIIAVPPSLNKADGFFKTLAVSRWE